MTQPAVCTQQTMVSRSDYLMGTPVQQVLYGDNAQQAAQAASEEISRLEALWSPFRLDSDLCRLAERAGQGMLPLHRDTWDLLQAARTFAIASGGAFEPTVFPLSACWADRAALGRPPRRKKIRSLLPLVDYRGLNLGPAGQAGLRQAGMAIDPGGIGKGLAADRALAVYRNHSISSGLINLGGNVLVLGHKTDGSPWRVGIRRPSGTPQDCIGYVEATDCSVVTAGYYERCFVHRGKLYHHILDPATGYPADNNLASVTVVAPDSCSADALASAAFVLGPDQGLQLIDSSPDTEALFLFRNGHFLATKGLTDRFHAVS